MNKLDEYKFSTNTGFNSKLLELRYEHFKKFFKGKTCLELGCADGKGTKMLLKYFDEVVAVDGSEKLINQAKREIKSSKVTFITSYFENLITKKKFDVIVLAHILEHVDDPVQILKVAKKFLKKGGHMLVDVPNALSIHRQVGVLMGMIKTEYTLNDADLSIGHQRVYDLDLLKKDMKKVGLKVVNEGGIFLKPFSNAQMETLLDEKGVNAFNEVGSRYPHLSAEIFVVCTV